MARALAGPLQRRPRTTRKPPSLTARMVRAGTAEVKDLSEGRNSTGYPYWPAGKIRA